MTTFNEFKQSLQEKESAEGELITTILISLISSLGLLALIYFIKLKNIEGFLSNQGYYLFFAVLSYVFLIPAIRHVRAYKEFTCMTGMMIGMTLGMISGFVIGYYIGATNGMFWGSVFGMTLGITIGIWNGSCCGIMGWMEGVMAGMMGGLMGGMTAIMLINDHLKAMTIILFIITTVMIIGLNYLIFHETRQQERKLKEDQWNTVIISIFLTSLTLWMMIQGPRGGIFA
ncbi:MAG TPA: hypothetical protein VJB87_00935 [Candidatus Nanoarchaeia archaeon]|nr:hypothetical protein [Candidatus Nanoarchaeia archaeon]